MIITGFPQHMQIDPRAFGIVLQALDQRRIMFLPWRKTDQSLCRRGRQRLQPGQKRG